MSIKLDQWTGIFNPEAGWAQSGDALKSVAEEVRLHPAEQVRDADSSFDTGGSRSSTARMARMRIYTERTVRWTALPSPAGE